MKILARFLLQGWLLWSFTAGRAVADSAPQVHFVRVPEGGVQPQALVDSEGTIHLVFLKGDPKASEVIYARRPLGTTNFTNSWRINSRPGSAISIGTVRGAQLALGRNGRVHVAWNGSDRASTNPSGGAPMLYARLNDAGDGFEPERDLMTMTTHLDGGGSVAADNQGHVYVVWHGHRRAGPQEEIDRGVFAAFSADDGKTFTPEKQVNPPETGACGCCGLKAFANDQGLLAILYRSAGLTGNRDSTLLLSTNLGVSFAAKVLGPWHVSTCPMSTYFVGQGHQSLLGSWEKEGQIYFASIFPDRLEPIPRVASVAGSTGNRRHPNFARSPMPGGPFFITWTEGTGWERGGALAWACVDDHGAQTASGRVEGVPVWSFAAAVAEPNGSFTVIY